MFNESLTERAVELLCRLIEVPRISGEEEAAADLLQDYMEKELGLEVKRDFNNLWSVQPNFDAEKPTMNRSQYRVNHLSCKMRFQDLHQDIW